MDNIFNRNISLLGKDKVDLISKQNILIIGLGGVGGYATESLVRLGYSNLTILDYDRIDETNINRQIIALNSNINKLKTEEFKKRILDINPKCNLKIINQKLDSDLAHTLITSEYDYVVDCIDDVMAKIAIYQICLERNINLISSMGMANKINPQLVKIDKLSKTEGDKLAKKIRSICKDEHINIDKIKVVYSSEPGYSEIKEHLPSIVLVPASAGLNIAYFILKETINKSA